MVLAARIVILIAALFLATGTAHAYLNARLCRNELPKRFRWGK
jgi:hypothetical protein